MYESRFKETIDYVMLRALDKSVAARTDAALGKRSTEESTLPKVCAIHFCPDGEPKDEAQDEFAVRVTNNMTFRDLRVNAARQHGPTVAGSPALAAASRSSLPAGPGRPSCSPQRSACLRGCRPGPANGWLRFLCLQSPSRPPWPLQAACVSYPSPEPLTLPLSLTLQARYVSLVPENCLLEDQRGAQWPLDAGVMREVQRFRGAHTVRLVRREEEDADDEREEIAEQDTLEEEAEDEPAVGDLMALLNAANAGDQRAEGDEGGGGEEDQAAVPGLLDDDSDSDDDGKRGALRTSLLSASPCSQRPPGPTGGERGEPSPPGYPRAAAAALWRLPHRRRGSHLHLPSSPPIFTPHLHPPSSALQAARGVRGASDRPTRAHPRDAPARHFPHAHDLCLHVQAHHRRGLLPLPGAIGMVRVRVTSTRRHHK